MSRKKPYTPKGFECVPGTKTVSANLYASMLQSEAYTSLKPRAKAMYPYIKLQYYGQKTIPDHTDTEFYFNWAMVKGYELYTNPNQFREDMRSLVEHGFIEVTEHGKNTRTKNIYKFSDKWQTWRKD